MKNKVDILSLLDRMRNKGACIYSQNEAERLFKQLKKILKEDEFQKLSTAHSHYVIGEGAGEFYEVCEKLNEVYSDL